MLRLTCLLLVLSSLALTTVAVADERDSLKVGLQPDGRILVPTNQIPVSYTHLTLPTILRV